MPDYLYSLDSSSRKYNCPQCKQKTFVAYVDNESKQPVDETKFGRCDRENSCSYHLGPWNDQEYQNRTSDFKPRRDPEVRQIYPDEALITRLIHRTKTCVTPLHRFCNRLTIPNEHLLRFGVYSDDDKTVFAFRNTEQRIVNFKWFKYQDNGHRDKAFKSFSLKSPPAPPKESSEESFIEKYKLCLFGEHLLDPEKQKIVVVVESEKTAVMASFFYSQFDWVSCASNNGLTDEKIRVLHNRKVYWLCDSDAAGRNNKSLERAKKYIDDFYVCDIFPERHDGYDIADAIIDGLRPDISISYKPSEKDQQQQKIENDDAFSYDLPEGVKFEDVKWDIRKYMHFEFNGRIYIVRKRKANDSEKGAAYFAQDITNFTIKSIGHIASDIEPSRLVEVKNVHGRIQVVQLPTKCFSSPNEFTTFIESVGNFQYDGVGNDLKKIRSKIYDEMLTYQEVKRLGWQAGYFVFANGAYNGKFVPIDKYGFVKLGDHNFFIQPLSCITSDQNEDWEDEKKFIFRQRDVTFKDWANLFCRVHKDNGRIVLAWYITSLFRDFIYQRFKFFPHCFLFGPPGTGKSQVGWSIRATTFVGLKKPFNLNSGTDVSFFREMAQYVNVPCWYDEFGLGIEWKRVEALKNAYDGAGHAKAVDKSETRSKKTPVHSACLISGQSLPVTDVALFKRVILLQFHQTEFTNEEREIYKRLQDMETGGLTHITAGFMHFRNFMEERYLSAFEKVFDDMMRDANEMQIDVEDRIIRNSCIILTTIFLLSERIPDKMPFTYDELRRVIMKNVKEQTALISSSNETSTFWEMVEFLLREKKIQEGEDFVFDEKKLIKVMVNREEQTIELSKTTEVIMVRFSKIIPLYRENFRKQNASNSAAMDKGSLIHYLTHSKQFIGLVGKVNFKDSRTSAYCFNYEMLRAAGITLGGSEGNDGSPPPIIESKSVREELPF